MRSRVVATTLLLLAISAPAHADGRGAVVSFAGGLDAIGPLEDGPEDLALQLRATLAFEEPPLPYKEPKGYAVKGTVVPELFAGRLSAGDDRVALFGAGARFELQMSQRRMGLLEASARGGVYVAARAGLFADDDRTRFLEGAIGEYFLIGDTVRLGFEFGLMSIRTRTYETLPVDGAVYGAPFEQGRGSYLNASVCAYLGVAL